MTKRVDILWDLILSAELSGHYKSHEEAYLTAVDLLDLTPHQVMMVAAHEMDLNAARDAGLYTAYVHRPQEWGPQRAATVDRPDDSTYDVVVDDFVALAETLNT